MLTSVSFAGKHTGLPDGALQFSKLAVPLCISLGNGTDVLVAAAFVLACVALASPVGTATCSVVLWPSIVVRTKPADASVEAEDVAVEEAVVSTRLSEFSPSLPPTYQH